MKIRKIKMFLPLVLLIGFAAFSVSAQCYQDRAEKLALIKEAESQQYNVRRIEISGNTYTRHRVFVEKMFLNEGDIFRSNLLMKTILNISKIKAIKPITFENVEIRLDRKFKDIDFVFCVVEKEKKFKYE